MNNELLGTVLVFLLVSQINSDLLIRNYDVMKCSYGERGSLTARCINATPDYFKHTSYRFDHLDETLVCLNCTLNSLETGTFDLSGNQIRILDLSNSQMEHIRQRAFVGLIFLEKLILSNNKIKMIYPGTFTGVKKIHYVDLQNNSINILPENGFQELINLKTLLLRHNSISIVRAQAFDGLQNLETLDLSYNELTNVRNIVNNLTSLKVLNFNYNKISNLSGEDFNNLTSLLELSFAGNQIINIPPLEFISLTSLRQLDLSYNHIKSIQAGSFQGLTALENLDISYNNITEVPQKTLLNLHSLRHFNISYNKIVTFTTGLYSGLPQLRVLNMSHNAIEAIEVTGVFSLHSVHTLDLSYNHISDVDFVALIKRLPRISYLNLVNNLLPCSLEKEMQEFFSEDNFKFILFDNEVGAVVCVNDTKTERTFNKTYKAPLIRKQEQPSNAATIWVFVLISIVIILITVLFYLQYRTFQALGMTPFRRTSSDVQLISSDLEARDNDYLNK